MEFRRIAWGVCFMWLLGVAPAWAATRVALVSDSANEKEVDVLQGVLSSDAGLEFVDRSSIAKVMAEQKLAVLAEPERALAVGKVLRADVFAVVEYKAKPVAPLGLVVYDAVTGVRLADMSLPEVAAEAVGGTVLKALKKAAEKRAAGVKGQRTLCLIAARNSNMARDRDGFCESLGVMLQRSLVQSPDLLILDRQRLEHLNKERALMGGAADPMAASLVMMELDVSRSPDGHSITVMCVLTDSSGGVLGKPAVTGLLEQAGALPGRLAGEITGVLKAAAPAGEANLGLEAKRFEVEAAMRFRHADDGAGLAAAEAAYALEPEIVLHAQLLGDGLMRRAKALEAQGADGNILAAFAIANRAMELREESLRALRFPTGSSFFHHAYGFMAVDHGMAHMLGLRKFESRGAGDAVAEASRAFRRRYRDFVMSVVRIYVRLVEEDTRALPGFQRMFWQNGYPSGLQAAEETKHEYLRDIMPLGVWVMQRAMAGAAKERNWLYWDSVKLVLEWTNDWSPAKLSVGDKELLDAYYKVIEESPVAGISILGTRARLHVGIAEGYGKDQRRRQQARILDAATKAMEGPALNAAGISRLRYVLYNELSEYVFFGQEVVTKEDLEVCDAYASLMISRHEMQPIMVGRLLDRYAKGARNPGLSEASLALIQKLGALAEAADTQFPYSTRDQVQKPIDAHRAAGDIPGFIALVPVKVKWKKVVGEDFGRIEQSLVDTQKDVAYAMGITRNGEKWVVEAVEVPLTKGEPKALGRLIIESPGILLNDASMDEKNIYVASSSAGVLVFPRDGSAGRTISMAQGLPSDKVQSAASLDGKLYVGYGQLTAPKGGDFGYLACFDFKTEAVTLLASSRRKEHVSPFDDCARFDVHFVVSDVKRHRLLVCISHRDNGFFDPLTGLWAFDPATNAFKMLKRFDNGLHSRWTNKPGAGELLLFGTTFDAVAFDGETDKCMGLYNVNGVSHLTDGKMAERTRFSGDTTLGAPWGIVGRELWSGGKGVMRILPGGGRQKIILPEELQFGYATFLQPIHGGKEMLIGTRTGMWVFAIPEDPRR